MVKRIFLLITCIVPIVCFSQSIADLQLPKIIPPSPDAAALGKYGQIPVDKSTGIPQISIPLYEIMTPRFKLPLSLSYHASGNRVSEIASWVGLGWSLMGSGLITRSVVGWPDDWGYGFLDQQVPSARNIQWPRDSEFVVSALYPAPGKDVQPDNFFYNFNGQSGAFVFGPDKKPVLIPYKAVRIIYNGMGAGFTITDESGNTYLFNTTENVESTVNQVLITPVSSWHLTTMISADRSDTIQFKYTQDTKPQNEFSFSFTQNVGQELLPGQSTLTAERLWDISFNNSIRTYHPQRLQSIVFKNGKVDFVTKGDRLDDANVSLDSIIAYSYNTVDGSYRRLKSVKLLTDYFYSTLPDSGPYLAATEQSKHRLILTGVTENDENNAGVKSYAFEYDQTMLPPVNNFGQDKWGYYNGKYNNQSLLEAQQVVGTNNVIFNIGGAVAADRSVSPANAQAGILKKIVYPTGGYTTFNYENNQVAGAYEEYRTVSHATAIGIYQETNIVYYTPTASTLSSGGDIFKVRLPHYGDFGYTLPIAPYVELSEAATGRVLYTNQALVSTDIDISIHIALVAGVQYKLKAVAQGGLPNISSQRLPSALLETSYLVRTGPTLSAAGGVRIGSIVSYGNDGNIAGTETYKYGDDENGGGTFLAAGYFNANSISKTAYFQTPPFCGNPSQCPSPIITANLKTYFDNSIYQLSTLSGSPVGYNKVVVYNGNRANNTGKSVYSYVVFADSALVCPPGYGKAVMPIPVTWKNGEPTAEAHYKNIGDNNYVLQQEKRIQYNYFSKSAGRGLALGLAIEPFGFNPLVGSHTPTPGGNLFQLAPQYFYWFDYPISSGVRVPQQAIVDMYDDNGTDVAMSDTTNYFYDNPIFYAPTRIERRDSRGLVTRTTSYTPLDKSAINAIVPLTSTASLAIDSMVKRNIISPTLLNLQQRDDKLVRLLLTNYKLGSNKILSPENVLYKNQTNPIERRLQFNKYDNDGNVVEQQKVNDVPAAYIWGYKNQYPIAEVNNAVQTAVAFTSFEGADKGNWVINSNSRSNTGNITGKQAYSLTSGAVTKAGLPKGGQYIVTYWTKGTSAATVKTNATTVSGSLLFTTAAGWRCYQHILPNTTTSVSITGTITIDELRLHPKDAQMTSYTYSPMVGLTSSNGSNNIISLYEYDGSQRLKLVRDLDGNILKKTEYGYQVNNNQ